MCHGQPALQQSPTDTLCCLHICSPRHGPSAPVCISPRAPCKRKRHATLQELDAQLQRALTYENFDATQAIRRKRQQVDEALANLQEMKGYGDGARRASHSDELSFVPQALSLRSQLAEAVAEERWVPAEVGAKVHALSKLYNKSNNKLNAELLIFNNTSNCHLHLCVTEEC